MTIDDQVILSKEKQLERDIFFLREAYKYGNQNSDDPSSATGVVIVKYDKILINGANRLPRGVKVDETILNSDAKYEYVEHAERDAIARAAAMGIPLIGSDMWSFWFPCAPCIRPIINSQIKTLITHKEFQDLSAKLDTRWADSQKYALDMLSQAGIVHRSVSCYVGDDIITRFKRSHYVQLASSLEFVKR